MRRRTNYNRHRVAETDTKHILSFRVTNEEKKIIESWAKENSLNTSSVLRAMFHYTQGSTDEVFDKYKQMEGIAS